ncbi:MAG: D-cysteine desulfhydrase family protein [Duodenibacillus sp.]|nr:D-cysteine desulfhydrase family protein [Duodenibacillus sp.]
MDLTARALGMFAALGKIPLGFYPTPLHRLERLSAMTGVDIWIKREDFSGASLFGGNKIRKLEYLLKEARDAGCDTVFTYGATQSNHAMQTACAARRCGMDPVLWLRAVVEPKAGEVRANLLLDAILGADVHILHIKDRAAPDVWQQFRPEIEAWRARLESEGRKVYDIPVGGSTPRGAVGFAHAYVELAGQCEAAGVRPDYLFTPSGSGGTLAGLAAGRALLHHNVKTFAVLSGHKPEGVYEDKAAGIANAALELLGAQERVAARDFTVLRGYVGEGYEIPYKAANDDIRLLARTEGLFADPVYSGKAFHGLMDAIRTGRVERGSTVVFVHTGGATALFAEPAIVGDLDGLS